MNKDKIAAKLVALSAIYEKDEDLRQPFVERLTFQPGELNAILKEVVNPDFKNWIITITR